MSKGYSSWICVALFHYTHFVIAGDRLCEGKGGLPPPTAVTSALVYHTNRQVRTSVTGAFADNPSIYWDPRTCS
jgi:hypothetical protein